MIKTTEHRAAFSKSTRERSGDAVEAIAKPESVDRALQGGAWRDTKFPICDRVHGAAGRPKLGLPTKKRFEDRLVPAPRILYAGLNVGWSGV
ncbi:MAG: hypothetical protein ABSC72_05675 [Methylovirgula sp.]